MKPFWAFLYVLMILCSFLVVSYSISKIKPLQNVEYQVEPDTISNIAEVVVADSLNIEPKDTLSTKNHSAEKKQNELEFPSGDFTVFDSFFSKIKRLEDIHCPLRILYFGDSQIEGDRITSTIREKFQKRFGGAGIGLVGPDLLYNLSHSFTIERSDNWKIVNFTDSNDSLKNRSLVFKEAILPANQKAWFKIKQIRNRENKADYLQTKMFYRASDDFDLVLKDGGTIIYQGKVGKTSSVKALNFNFNFTPASVEFFFQSVDSIEIFGFSLETPIGIQVDNIALRGLSYPPFSKSEKLAMEETIRLINPGLCVLHFGVNIAPVYRENYNNYRIRLVGEIRKIKQLMTDVPVLIVGISDMAKKENGNMISYPNIGAIKKAQQDAARICNCAFWDLEEFMGGEGSMINWVNASPRLGQKDYVHFTQEGTEKIGNYLSELILSEYNYYLKTRYVE